MREMSRSNKWVEYRTELLLNGVKLSGLRSCDFCSISDVRKHGSE